MRTDGGMQFLGKKCHIILQVSHFSQLIILLPDTWAALKTGIRKYSVVYEYTSIVSKFNIVVTRSYIEFIFYHSHTLPNWNELSMTQVMKHVKNMELVCWPQIARSMCHHSLSLIPCEGWSCHDNSWCASLVTDYCPLTSQSLFTVLSLNLCDRHIFIVFTKILLLIST